jgi:magnesium chelatase family protein
MTSEVISAANIGYEGRLIQIECDSSNGLPGLVIVGMANKAIEESKERMRSAIKNSGLDFPRKRVTLSLAPADLPKDGSSYDLPMAIAILAISGQVPILYSSESFPSMGPFDPFAERSAMLKLPNRPECCRLSSHARMSLRQN